MKSAREIRQAIEYGAVRAALALAGSLPLAMARVIGASIGALAYAVGIRRDVSIGNIVASLGVSRAEASAIAQRSYRNLGRSLMEFARFRRMTPDDVRGMVVMEGLEHAQAVLREGRGAIMVSGHYGNWELAGSMLVASGLPIHFLVGEQTNHRVDDVMNNLRRTQGIGIITRASALRKVLQALRDNQFIALLADQDARKGGVVVNFLGRPASTVRGPAVFAIRAGCPILPFDVHREGGTHHAVIHPPLWPDAALDEETRLVDLTQRYTDILSQRIRERPDEYFWPHRRWKSAQAHLAEKPVSSGG